MDKYLYYIKNTTFIWNGFKVSGYFLSLDEAKEAMKSCRDNGKKLGTGTIYKVAIGVLNPKEYIVYRKG